MSEEWGFPTSLLNSIKNCKPQEHIFWNCSAASRTNSRRRQVSTDNTLPKYILTAQVTWSIFHGKTEALKLLLTSAHAVGSSLLLKDHGSCRLHYFKSWDSLASKDLLCLDSAMEVLDSEQKAIQKLLGFLWQSWDQESHKSNCRFTSELCSNTSVPHLQSGKA